MEFEVEMKRSAPKGGDKVTDVAVQYFATSYLQHSMGIKDVVGGTFAVGRNDEGFIIQLGRPSFTNDEYSTLVDQNKNKIKEAGVKFFGLEE